MKNLFSRFLLILFLIVSFAACKKDSVKSIIVPPANGTQAFSSSVSTVVLSAATDAAKVVTFSFKAADYGVKVVPTYTLQFDVPADTVGPNAWANAINVKLPVDSLKKTYLGADFNALLSVQLMLPTGVNSTLVVRLKTDVNQNSGIASTVKPIYSTLKMTVNPYKSTVEYPALLVKGGNSWKTPTERTNGFLLASAKFNAKYEGYLNLPNADGWGGDAFQLISTKDAKVYGWGTNANTLSVGGGNLWLTPSPAYMKVNADLDLLTITYTAVKFFISGDDNNWSTSATPMVYNSASKTWIAANVALTAGKTIVFTANGSYDISYKVDNKGSLVFAGAPTWGGINIPVAKTGVFTVTLDLSAGDGNYTYSIK
ncbi:MAG: SusE domain-containing protein [Candidatus Pedobacter colombiensis]|uniref:SusE domain-containing protein n=1 Tax=Candidatus Pedobacter colombiensis TaxID=3121371 RepID=A0AAJ5WAI3_9SPHI|nr:SusE domain-containing protein [Pedobacter sp.]WEK21036.1 MAG: SusE domain-containing protein [Pedobacter sp.]